MSHGQTCSLLRVQLYSGTLGTEGRRVIFDETHEEGGRFTQSKVVHLHRDEDEQEDIGCGSGGRLRRGDRPCSLRLVSVGGVGGGDTVTVDHCCRRDVRGGRLDESTVVVPATVVRRPVLGAPRG